MKRVFITIVFAFCLLPLFAQQSFYQDKLHQFAQMRPIDSTDVVMLGDGLTEYAGDWNVLLRWKHIRNRGIAGDAISGLSARLSQVMKGHPKKVFVMIGIRNILDGMAPSVLVDRYASMLSDMRRMSPKTKVFVQSVLPITESYGKEELKGKTNVVAQVDRSLRVYCEKNGISYINLFKSFVRRGTNEMRRELTSDGLELTPFGYKLWAFELKKYLID